MSAPLKQAFAHFKNGELDNAQKFLTTALVQDPKNADAWHLRGMIALNRSQTNDAVAWISRAHALKPDDRAICINLAAAYNAAQQFEQALQIVAPILASDAPPAEAYFQAGIAYRNLRRATEAAAVLTKCIVLRPGWAMALEMLADSLSHAGEHEESVERAMQALALDPNLALCHRVIGDAYTRWVRYDEALEHFRRAVALAPRDGSIRANYALLLTRMGHHAESAAEYRIALKAEPRNKPAWEGYAMEELVLGNFDKGWPHYAGRIKALGAIWAERPGPPAATDPAQLTGKPILAWLNQGIGDQILFSSLIPDLIKTGADLTIECDDRLIPLIKRSFPEVTTRPLNETPTAEDNQGFAHQVYVPDAARWFRTSFEDFPRPPGYLKADAERTQRLRADYLKLSEGRPLVGIAWRTADNAKIAGLKTVALETWAPLLTQRHVTFISLQYGDLRSDIMHAVNKIGTPIVHDSGIDAVKDIDAFAAQVAAMDLVITTSNATAHMAGALNVPAWTFVPMGYGILFHWFLEREDSPWYPSLRLLRQTKQGEWNPVMEQAARMLAAFPATRQP